MGGVIVLSAAVGPIVGVALAVGVILVVAKVGGDLAVRLGQPAVLGELLAGVVLGGLGQAGVPLFAGMATDPSLDLLAQLGVLLLLFEVGLESTVAQMLKVGVASLLVAVAGVVAPFALGWLAGAWLLPEAGTYAHAFIGATLCATSVGITARVLQDLGRSKTNESRIILGAAVIDDVLGLVVLAVVGGIITAADKGEAFSTGSVALIVLKATVFLVGSLVLGVWLSPRVLRLASGLRSSHVALAMGLAFCFLLAWLAGFLGLAPIVGAFAAGLILEDVHFQDFTRRGEAQLEELVHPITGFLTPVFFVLMGMRTDLRAFADPGTLLLAGVLTVAAILGKQACSLAVPGKGLDRLSIGIGMVPRGEVGLIFASIGQTLTLGGKPIITPAVYSAIVVMVILTTLVTPPGLKWSLARHGAAPGPAPSSQP